MNEETFRILVPLDGSPTAETILPVLQPLVASQPAKLTLLRVINRVDEIEEARAYLSGLHQNLGGNHVQAVTRLEFGRPADEILQLCKHRRHDLAAMTTHGRTGLRRVFMGSVAEEVLRHASIPLLLTRPGAKIGDWKRIVVALDGSEISERILEDVSRLALQLQATLHVVRVSLPLLPTADMFFEPPPAAAEDPQSYLEEVCTRLATREVFAVPVRREGFAGVEITKYASEIGAGLITMMTEGRSGLPRLISGSVAEEVLRSAPCPVLIRRWAPVGKAKPVPAGTP